MIRTLTVLGMILFAAPALAQEGPSFDCSKATHAAEELICKDPDLAALDRRLAKRYAAALNATGNLDTEAAKNLRASQRGWIKGRDECWKSNDLRACVMLAYLRREGELVAKWLLQKPTKIAFWACNGNPANEVVTYFFNTQLPSVRFERGDTIDEGSLTPTASGSKYEGSFGRSIRINGKKAIYREPDPNGATYDCVLASQK